MSDDASPTPKSLVADQVTPPPKSTPAEPPVITAPQSTQKILLIAAGCLGLLVLGGGITFLLVRPSPSQASISPETTPVDSTTAELELLRGRIDKLQTKRQAAKAELETVRQDYEVWQEQQQELEQQIRNLEGTVSQYEEPAKLKHAATIRDIFPEPSYSLPSVSSLALLGFPSFTAMMVVQADEATAEKPPQKSLREKMTDEVTTIQDEIAELQSKKAEITRQRDRLKKQVESLKKGLTRLRAFQTSDFLVIQPQSLSLGIRVLEDGQFQVVARAEGRIALSADRMAYSSNIHRVRDNRLARDLWLQADVAGPMKSSLVGRLAAHWQPRIYIPDDATEMVAFHDLRRGQHRIGYYQGHDENSVRFVGISSAPERMPRSHINVGSAQRGRPEELLEQDDQFDFIDYCLLQVAKKMNSPDESTYHRLAIHVKLDLSRAGLRPIERPATGDPVNDFLALVASANSRQGIQLDAIRGALEDDVYWQGRIAQSTEEPQSSERKFASPSSHATT